jgi:predicted dienelactone hydrolase
LLLEAAAFFSNFTQTENTSAMKFILIILLAALSFKTTTAQPWPVGKTTINFVDPQRNNRVVNTAIYYPAVSAGSNMPAADGVFPVISFGHGFVMVHTAYQYLWEAFVPRGYILAFPTTESTAIPAPSHENFGMDLIFVVQQMRSEGLNPPSLFHGHIAQEAAVMGHSMGGGATFLGCSIDTSITTQITLAAANTVPSAVQAAGNISIPSLIFAGQNDCVTPPAIHQQPMYDSLAGGKKALITVLGGGHCYFADYNFNCSLGELTCSPSPSITRSEQQDVVVDFLNPWLEMTLKGNPDAWYVFYDSLMTSARIAYQLHWLTTGQRTVPNTLTRAYPNPFRKQLTLECQSRPCRIRIISIEGKEVHIADLPAHGRFELDTSAWPAGWYILHIESNEGLFVRKLLKRK